jgi:hypothetical protein
VQWAASKLNSIKEVAIRSAPQNETADLLGFKIKKVKAPQTVAFWWFSLNTPLNLNPYSLMQSYKQTPAGHFVQTLIKLSFILNCCSQNSALSKTDAPPRSIPLSVSVFSTPAGVSLSLHYTNSSTLFEPFSNFNFNC